MIKVDNLKKSTFFFYHIYKGGDFMGRPKGGKNRNYTPEYKLSVIKRHIEKHESLGDIGKDESLSSGMIANWCKSYHEKGIDDLRPKKEVILLISCYPNH